MMIEGFERTKLDNEGDRDTIFHATVMNFNESSHTLVRSDSPEKTTLYLLYIL